MEEYGLITIEGTVQNVIFQNPENGYTVLRLRVGSESVTAVGCLPGACAGEGLRLVGSWTSHQSYGQQFKAEQAERYLPEGAAAIYDYLASGAVKGIGAKTARLIVSEFKGKTLEVMENSPEELAKIRGITPRRAQEIGERFRQQTGLRRLMEFLVDGGVRPLAAARLYRVFGDDAQEEITRNPYLLADEMFGLSFFEADAFARNLGFDENSPERIGAAVLFEMRHNLGNGHVFLPKDKLNAATAQLLGMDSSVVTEVIEGLIDGGSIKCETLAGLCACYLDDMYYAETAVAERILLMASRKAERVPGLKRLIERTEYAYGIEYAEKQRLAVETAAESYIMVLTGGPGTGKTTTVRGILELFDELGLETVLTAPTGRAAKRLSELTGREAQTVHRLLGAGMPQEGMSGREFEKCASDPLKCGAVILDETSMMDISLMEALLDAMPLTARLVLVGDADQLPSVGPGNVFADIIRSGVVPVVSLTEIFRQAQESGIVRSAHMINSGRMPPIKNTGGDFFFLQRNDPAKITQTVTGLISQRLPQKMGIPPREIQVLSPSRKNGAGTRELNAAIQAAVNPPSDDKKEKTVGGVTFRVGDRVMQTRNNYDILWYRYADGFLPDIAEEGDEPQPKAAQPGAGIFNGDVGYIESIDEPREYVFIRFEDRLTPYPFDMLGDLELAYAVTVHKSQGSEYRAVILALPKVAPGLVTRGLLYTAVTRARELLIITGEPETMAAMVENDRRARRYSGLRARLAGEIV
ncbi:MAG: AAA family ATPase [Oscillospiraceae bacterium]